ncbi:MAG: TonB-dependent receptor [Gammaproteobacteria bacterium]|nr:TonB-dependent receptor [Gammaproteobacteria bacterium]
MRFAALFIRGTLLFGLTGAAQAAEEPAEIEEIVVTAQKREQAVQDVPLSISAFTGENLEAEGILDLQGVGRKVPSVAFTQGFASNASVLTIRGLSAASGGDPTTSYYLDEYAYGSPSLGLAPPVDLYDLERIEVLRGPQGTLWGASSMGGMVRLITRDPDASAGFGGKAQFFGSGFEDGGENFGGDLALNLPLIEDKLAARIVGSYREMGGFIDRPDDEDANEVEHQNYRVKVKYTPTEQLVAEFSLMYTEDAEPFGMLVDLPAENRSAASINTDFDSEQIIYSFSFSYDFGDIVLENATAYGEWDEYQLFANPFFIATNPISVDTFSQELRLLSDGASPLKWIGGVFFRESDQAFPLEFDAFGVFETDDFGTTDTQEWSVFGEVAYEFMDGMWEILAGIRYSSEARDFVSDVTQVGLIPGIIPSFQIFEERSETFKTTNPRFNITFRPNDEVMAYVNVAKGYRPGRVNYAGPIASAMLYGITGVEIIEDDLVWSYELGTKMSLADNSLMLEAAVFYTDWQDAQWNVGLPLGTGIVYNAGDIEIMGVDIGMNYQTPVDGLSIALTANYTDGEWKDVFNPVTTAVAPEIASGMTMPGTPEWTMRIGFDYVRALGAGELNLLASANYYYRDEQSDIAGLTAVAPSMDIVGLTLGVESPSWRVVLFANNLTDHDEVIITRQALPVVANPREIGLRVSMNF